MTDQPCSDASRARGDRWVGTAPPARRWFLVTQGGDWGVNAMAGLAAEPGTKVRLGELLGAAGARLMLIRRPGRPHEETPAWVIVDRGATPRIRWGERHSDEDLLRAAATLLEPAVAGPDEDPAPDPGLLLVCTHGRHDRCCAVRGRPVAAALAKRWPEATWECTHTGGDRFAANLVVLPDGACYGGLDPDQVVRMVEAHYAGQVDPTHLRGPTGLVAPAQAAVVAAHHRWGPLAWGDVAVRDVRRSAEGWTVELVVAGTGVVHASGHTELSEPHLLTCRATAPDTMALPLVDDLVVVEGS